MQSSINLLKKYFSSLSDRQVGQLEMLEPLYREWNARINVISRQDIDNIVERHILHSLAIAKILPFTPGSAILDAGTGGGFPGIPLAILFPDTHFHLVDSTAKKLHVVAEIARAAGLENITTEHIRLEDHQKRYDFVVSRAVSSIPNMINWVWKNVSPDNRNDLPNGILYLKGGEFEEELRGIDAWTHGRMDAWTKGSGQYHIYRLSEIFEESFFETKSLIHLF
jgi:16S rRNA (guanine527-N7)-methyltransferase